MVFIGAFARYPAINFYGKVASRREPQEGRRAGGFSSMNF